MAATDAGGYRCKMLAGRSEVRALESTLMVAVDVCD